MLLQVRVREAQALWRHRALLPIRRSVWLASMDVSIMCDFRRLDAEIEICRGTFGDRTSIYHRPGSRDMA
jgi:hypothetical protein